MNNMLGDIHTIVHEDYHNLLDTIPDSQPYNLIILYVPSKDRIVVCVNTDNIRFRKYIAIESATGLYSAEELNSLDKFNYDDLRF